MSDLDSAGVVATAPREAYVGQSACRATSWATRPAVQCLLALAVYLVVYIIRYAEPLLRHLDVPAVAQTYPDPNFYLWSWGWWPHAILHGLNPLFSGEVGAPTGYGLAWTTPSAALAVLLAPVTALFGPVVSFNLVVAVAAPVSGWAAFLAARRLTGRFWPALAAGAVYAFSWYEVGESAVGQPNLCVNVVFPLLVYLVALWRDEVLGARAFVVWLAAALTAEFYLFIEAFFWVTVLGTVLGIIGFGVAGPARRPWVARLARLAAAAWAMSVALASPYLAYMLVHAHTRFSAVGPGTSIDLRTMLVPRYGVVLLIIALGLACLSWRSRLTRLLVIGLVLVLALGVGPQWVYGRRVLGSVPWGALWRLPFVASSEPVRFLTFAYLLLSMILAVWLAMPARSRLLLAAHWLLGLAAISGMIVQLPAVSREFVLKAGHTKTLSQRSNALPEFFASAQYRTYLHPGETVVVVSTRGNAGMLFQAYTGFYFRLSGGFTNVHLNSPDALPPQVRELMHPSKAREGQFLSYARQAAVGAVIVENAWASPWMSIFRQMGLQGTNVGGVTIYRTGAADSGSFGLPAS